MRMTVDTIERQLARVQVAPVPRRGVVGTILLHRIEDTDRVVDQHPLLILGAGALALVGMWIAIISVAERVLG